MARITDNPSILERSEFFETAPRMDLPTREPSFPMIPGLDAVSQPERPMLDRLPDNGPYDTKISAPPLDPLGPLSTQRILETVGESVFPLTANVPKSRPSVKIPGTKRSLDLMGGLSFADLPNAPGTAFLKSGAPFVAMILRSNEEKVIGRVRRVLNDTFPDISVGALDEMTPDYKNALVQFSSAVDSLKRIGADFENFTLPSGLSADKKKFARKMMGVVEDLSLPLSEGAAPREFSEWMFSDLQHAFDNQTSILDVLPQKLSKSQASLAKREKIGLRSAQKAAKPATDAPVFPYPFKTASAARDLTKKLGVTEDQVNHFVAQNKSVAKRWLPDDVDITDRKLADIGHPLRRLENAMLLQPGQVGYRHKEKRIKRWLMHSQGMAKSMGLGDKIDWTGARRALMRASAEKK